MKLDKKSWVLISLDLLLIVYLIAVFFITLIQAGRVKFSVEIGLLVLLLLLLHLFSQIWFNKK
jgi:hypothetical protein